MNPPSPSEHDPNALTVAQARERILAAAAPVQGVQRLALRAALGRVLAADVISPMDVPGHDNSAMDGYVLRGEDLPQGEGTVELALAGESFAGSPFEGSVAAGQAVRIMTGAMIPAGSDTVVQQEHAEAGDGTVRIGPGHKVGQNVRKAGEDLARGAVVLAAGRRLTPADLGLLASLGIAEVGVRRRPRVAFFSTGDELRSLGEPLEAGQIYDSNRYTLYAMLTRLGVEVLDMGVVRDRREAVREAFEAASSMADAVITSGGVSVGEADYVKETLDALGQVGFWKIAMKPGRPLAFGRVGGALFFGLPGNPVSVMATFYLFVQQALRRLGGEEAGEPLRLAVPCTERLKKRLGRMDFQRGVLFNAADGSLQVRSTGPQGSGILRSMSDANCFIVLPEDATGAQPGDAVEVVPFAGLV